MPDEIDLEFSEAVVWARVELRSGAEDGPLVQLAGSERLASPSTMVRRPIVGVHKSGSYDVSWRVLSVDGHVTSGAYAFEVE
jgi:methionine-rich copper-binding protein CopC